MEFGFRQHGGVGQLSIKFDSVVDNNGDEWSYGKRIRVLVTEPAAPFIPMGGMMSLTGHSTYYVQELPKQIIVDNITLSGVIIPMSVEDTVYGNPSATSQSIIINDNDVNGLLYDADGEPITDRSKLYDVKSIVGTGSGSIPGDEYLELIAGFRWDVDGAYWRSINFDYNPPDDNYWWFCILSASDKELIQNFGLMINNASYLGSYGGIIWPEDYSFECLAVYSDLGQTQVEYDLSTMQVYPMLAWNSYAVAIRNLQKNATYLKSWKVRITKTGSQSFTDLDTLRQMGLVSTYFDSQGRLRLKFACTGTGITFTGAMDSALIIAAVKQQMTVDNIGLHGMIGPMGGMMTEYVPLPTVFDYFVFDNAENKTAFGVVNSTELIIVENN